MENLPIPNEFRVEDFRAYLKGGIHSNNALKSLLKFQQCCPANFTDFPEREQVLMSFAFLQGFEAGKLYDKYETERLPKD